MSEKSTVPEKRRLGEAAWREPTDAELAARVRGFFTDAWEASELLRKRGYRVVFQTNGTIYIAKETIL